MTGHAPAAILPAGSAGRSRRVGITAFAIAFALLLHPLLGLVLRSGRYLPPHEFAADYLLGLLWSTGLGATILVWPVPWRDRLLLLAAWVVRVGVMFGFMLYYEWSYPTLDAFGYFAAGLTPVFDWTSVGFGRGTEILNAFAWLHARVVPGSYHAMKATCAMAGLAGVALFYRAAVVALGHERRAVLGILLFTPSVLFWSSILGKDPLILFGVALYAYGVVCWQRRGAALYLLPTVTGVLIAAGIRIWFAPILLGPLFLLILVGLRSTLQRIVFSLVGAAMLWLAIEAFRQQFAIASIRELLSVTNQWSQGWAYGGSAQRLATEFTGIGSMLRFLPLGIFTALFRPLPGEVMNMFGLLAGLENLCLLGLALVAVARTRPRELGDPIVLWALAWILAWGALYSFVSYQNLGTAVRFKLQILPVLLLLSLHLVRRRSTLAAPDAAVS